MNTTTQLTAIQIYQKEYRSTHAEKRKAYAKEYHKNRYANDPAYKAKLKKQLEDWGRINHNKRPSIYRKWRLKNLRTCAEHASKRRALQKRATVNTKGIQEFLDRIKSLEFVNCYYCKALVPSRKIHIDHIVPICKGGNHEISNLCAACPRCNQTKREKTLDVWPLTGQRFFNF